MQGRCIGLVGKDYVRKKKWVVGFKEIEKFNDDLLAKQVWRMINNSESLYFWVFKARLFPNCSILDAKDNVVGSYVWKSIISARDVIQRGMVWRIGNDQSVRVKRDKWLPMKDNSYVVSPLPSVIPETRMSSLINSNLGMWKYESVQQLFLPHKASLILGIPFSLRMPADRVV